MYKKLFFILLGLVLIALICFTVWNRTAAPKERISTFEKNNSAIEVSPTKFEDKFCAQLSSSSDVPAKIVFIDVKSKLVFCENNIGVMPVLANKEFTDFKRALGTLDLQEFGEELVEKGYISYAVDSLPNENFSMISGFATDKVKTIVINSEGNIQPNRFIIGDNLWFWYATFHKEKVNMPPKVTSYDAKGHKLTDVDE